MSIVHTKPYVIYSALFGDYDNIVTPSIIHNNVDYIIFTDQDLDVYPWKCVKVDWFNSVDDEFTNRRAARHFKALPNLYMTGYEACIWIDMTHELSLIHI